MRVLERREREQRLMGVRWLRAERLWLQGYSLAAIAREVGCSRQWLGEVRDLLPKRPWVDRTELAYLVSSSTLMRWINAGKVRVSPSNLVNRDEVEDYALALMERGCEYPECGEQLGTLAASARFCAEHSVAVRHNRYPVMSAEERKRHVASVKKWCENNPKRAAAIEKRAQINYRAKKKREKREKSEDGGDGRVSVG